MRSYASRLADICATSRTPICVGIDPHPQLLSDWGLSEDAAGVEAFSRGVIEALGEKVAVFKPQSAFFERFGSAGIAVLERTLSDIAAVGALSILDIKRGDIGSTMTAYAQAYLSTGSSLAADAITVSPFLGFGSLSPAFELANQEGRGVYVLARTSNPEGIDLQLSRQGDRSIAQTIVDGAAYANSIFGNEVIGLVIGATIRELQLDLDSFNGSILAPGIGAQGGKVSDLPKNFGNSYSQILPMVGRSVLQTGPKQSTMLKAVARVL